MFRCPGHARTTTASAGSSLITPDHLITYHFERRREEEERRRIITSRPVRFNNIPRCRRKRAKAHERCNPTNVVSGAARRASSRRARRAVARPDALSWRGSCRCRSECVAARNVPLEPEPEKALAPNSTTMLVTQPNHTANVTSPAPDTGCTSCGDTCSSSSRSSRSASSRSSPLPTPSTRCTSRSTSCTSPSAS